MKIETNVFPIINLNELTSAYRLYRIRGLQKMQPEYYQNCQALIKKLSFALRSPVTVIHRDADTFLVVRDDAAQPPSPFPLVRTTAYFDRVEGQQHLDFAVRNPENDEICLRFLQFMLQTPLSGNPTLWQPAAGKPFFRRIPADTSNGFHRYVGFSMRAVVTAAGGLGICVDVAHKLVSARPLPSKMDLTTFRSWRGRHCIYHFGHQWYEIQLQELGDVTVSEHEVRENDKASTLLDYIVARSRKPIAEELAALPHDASLAYYYNNQGQLRAAPLGLCYVVRDNADWAGRNTHARSIMRPNERHALIRQLVNDNLQGSRFGGIQIQVSPNPEAITPKMFIVPDLGFGNSRVLSVRGTSGAQNTTLEELGRTRAALLRDRSAGFYVTDPLQRQYLFLPQSVHDSFGGQFVTDLKKSVDELFPQERGYDPVIVPYNDRGPKTFVDQGKAILAAAEAHRGKSGFGLVMIHATADRGPRQHDQLAAYVIKKLRELDIWVAVNHSDVGKECYRSVTLRDGSVVYQPRPELRSKLNGYLRIVALNKILLTNERWPFVLATPLHADLIVGIDVKHHTAGFTVVAKNGTYIWTICQKSSQKERLSADHVRKQIIEIVRREATALTPIRSIAIHRDGRTFPSELEGIRAAVNTLRQEGLVSSDSTYAVLEIPKTSAAPYRMFEAIATSDRGRVENPQVGTYHIISQADAYLCTTGRAFYRPGTVRPLHVKYIEGSLPFESALEDFYFLTALAWTRPEDCSRIPVTMKLTDRRLGDDSGEFDEDAIEFSDISSMEAHA